MLSSPRKTYKNRTLRIPAELLQRVQVKLAQEDRKLNGLVIEQLESWAGRAPDGGQTPGQRLVQGMARLGKRTKLKVPANLDKARLMGGRDE